MEAAITLWNLVIDAGLAGCLLLVAKILRSQVTVLQRLFVPSTLLAGLIGFVGGPSVLGWLPFSAWCAQYGGVLICAVFAGLGMTARFPDLDTLIHRTGRMWVFNQIVFLSQWIVGVGFAMVTAHSVFPGLVPAFGLIFPAGFMGGHGTAAGLGVVLQGLGWEDALSLGLTSATIGVFLAMLGGMVIINLFGRQGRLKDVRRFEELDRHFRRGLVALEDRRSIGEETVVAASLHVLSLHVGLLAVITFAAFELASHLSALVSYLSVPVFACCFLLGALMRLVLTRTGMIHYVDERIIGALASCATDFLIFFGVSSIQLAVLLSNTAPFLAIMLIGTALCLVLTMLVAPRVLGDHWAEKAVFSWGWMTGTVALGILLLRVCDPEGQSNALEDYAIAYVPGSIVEILLVSLVPGLVTMGYAPQVLGVLLLAILAILALFQFVIRRPART
ncbi:hypothetical protein MTR62_08185 [Novosphingobium sp. 1949]|uniref:Sodium:glutamate symporter n=1 Tax=Novosphingobium organovorum TaxID=2930092 RepID=A0ABT0BC85_9SPHN|nr:sodium/glutamate symporter [Novosphingobium organovorum]MCJ2182666.1 hypothetical protein [Novosphingobium organovorum]